MENNAPKKPAIDERLEALTQTVGRLTTLHRDLETETAARFKDTAARFKDTDARFKETALRFAETLDFINQLAHVAKDHEQRLEGLEGQ
jgi:hypothetical protein